MTNLPEDHVLLGGRITAGSQASRDLTASNISQNTRKLGGGLTRKAVDTLGFEPMSTTPAETSVVGIDTESPPKQAIENPRQIVV